MPAFTSIQLSGESVLPAHDAGAFTGRVHIARNQKRGGSVWAFETAD